ncbi:MAG: S8 family serine peptidase [Planctomycetes bacterium]|nr:S8 family serine peptidase [Planctomycetota bacterium]
MKPTSLARLALAASAALLAACGGGGGGGGGSSGGGDPPASTTQILVSAASLDDLEHLCDDKGARVIGPVEGTSYYLVEIPDGVDADDFLEDMDDELEVEDAEKDEGVGFPEGEGTTVPVFVDEGFDAITAQATLDAVGVPQARARGRRGAGVVVAVVDTGVDASSPALAGHLLPGFDFVDGDANPADVANGADDDGDGAVDEGVGHGTFVASLVLAVAPDASILPVRALNSDAVGTASTVARAIAWAVANGADVVNLSAGLRVQLLSVQQAIANAKNAGVPVIAAAGNRALSSPDFPASASDAFCVTSVTLARAKAPFASWGSAVDLCTPGVDVLGAHPRSPTGLARWSGTSFSTAIVTGGFALLRGADGGASSESLLQRLESTSVDVDAVNPLHQGKLGEGMLDLDEATAP